jgi:hypothetical protein
VYYTKINSDGSLGTWSTNSNYLPLAIDAHGSISANGYVYVIGLKYPVKVNGSFVLMDFEKNPSRDAIVKAFESFE